jgi:hypothetical protein
MKVFLLILTFLFSIHLYAKDLQYENFELTTAPVSLSQKWDKVFSRKGMIPLVDSSYGIPSLKVNQVHIVDDHQFVIVKYNIKGTFPVGQIIQTPKGYLVHLEEEGMKHLLYFRNFNEAAVKSHLNRLRNSTSWFKSKKFPSIISEAKAEAECNMALGSEMINQKAEMTAINESVAVSVLRGCISGLGEGIYDGTGGAASSIGNAILHPIDTIEAIGDKIDSFLTVTSTVVMGLVTNPSATLDHMGRNLGEGWTKIKDSVLMMNTEMRMQFLCSFIGAFGIDAALAFFTAGVLAPKMAMTLASLAKKFGTMGKLINLLSRLSSTVNKLKPNPEMMKRFMDKLMKNLIPDDELEYLNNMTKLGDDVVMGTMACYI